MKSKGMAIFLCCFGFIGIGGLHDFYLGRKGWRNC
jgi:TM2 domain-containing membrane protein YozV